MTMSTFYALLLATCLLAAQSNANDDSLKSALEAISRRQRDLVASGGTGYFAGLSQYRFPQREPEDELAFLAPAREFAGDGQPENIGYGYQKSAPSTSAVYNSASQMVREGIPGGHHSTAAANKALEKLLVEYIEDEYKNGNNEDVRYYHQGQDSKRSAFRERGGGDFSPESEVRFHPATLGRLEAVRKRGSALLPTAFRERVNNRMLTDEENFEAEKRRHFAKALAKEIENEEEEDMMEHEREQREEEEKEEEYLDLLQNIWEKYKQSNPSVTKIEDLSPDDVQDLISSIGESETVDRNSIDGMRTEAVKRQYGEPYGTGYDFFNQPGGMGGWGSIQYKKRAKQHLDGNENQQGNFLYALKFVTPVSNREAVEALKEDDSLELPDERDEDILRMASNNYNRQEPEVWIPNYEREEPVEEVYEPSEENYQRLLMASQNQRSASKKRVAQPSRSNFGYRPLASNEFMTPDDKRYMYEAAKHKRFPVTKRSSNFYTSPPLLHHKSFSNIETRKKKDASIGTPNTATDPKVARELNQIFSSSSSNNNDLSEENTHNSKATGAGTASTKTESSSELEVTTHVSVIPQNGSDNLSSSNSLDNIKNAGGKKDEKFKNESSEHMESNHHEQPLGDGETVEQPITMSRIQTPLEIKKKSIDWSDYFGIDRRKKKAGPVNINDLEGSGDGVVDDDWLLNQYYNTIAKSTNMMKRMPLHNPEHDHMLPSQAKEKKEHGDQPFDTRLFEADIFSRSAQREGPKRSNQKKDGNEESRIDNMDSKLRNIEDVIVNEAIKYTGSHEGATDPKEIQEVKDRILSRLAAAYSLEKMRLALREFKSSLQAQKMSKYNPQNQRMSRGGDGNNDDDKKDKRVAVKKEKAEGEIKEDSKGDDDDKKKKRDDKKDEVPQEFTNSLSDVEPLSEGYMGRPKPNKDHEDCPALDHILHKCHNVASLSGDEEQLFVPLCSWHQMCYLCGQEAGYSPQSACDFRFLKEADSLCMEDLACQQVARRSATILEHSQPGEGNEIQCWSNSCIAHYFLTSLLPNSWSR